MRSQYTGTRIPGAPWVVVSPPKAKPLKLTWREWFIVDALLWSLAALSYAKERKHA